MNPDADITKGDLKYHEDKQEDFNAKIRTQEKEISKLTIEKHTYKIKLTSLKCENSNLEGEYKNLHLKILQLNSDKVITVARDELKQKLQNRLNFINHESDKNVTIDNNMQNLDLEKKQANLLKLIDANKSAIDSNVKNK